VVNALTAPVNVLVPAGVVAAGVVAGAPWLAAVALLCWLALAAQTFFDPRAARAVGRRVRAARVPAPPVPALPQADPALLAPAIGRRVRAARAARASIAAAIDAAGLPLEDVAREVDGLVEAMQADALRAQRIHEFLRDAEATEGAGAGRDDPGGAAHAPARGALEARERALSRVRERLDRLLAGMDDVVLALQTVQADILATDGLARAGGERELASQVSELRAVVRAMSDGLEEAWAQTRTGLR
jgi:hypothetical protein